MEQPSKLPLLPSERKLKATEQSDHSKETSSPTQVRNLEIKLSESSGSSGSPTPIQEASSHSSTERIASPLSPGQQKDQDLLERKARSELVEESASFRPLPVATTAEHLLHFMNTTTNFMNKLEIDVSDRIGEMSHKIDNIDRKVSLIESKKRLEVEDCSAINQQSIFREKDDKRSVT
jgi:hypothetical protein